MPSTYSRFLNLTLGAYKWYNQWFPSCAACTRLTLHVPPSATVAWPGEYLGLDIPVDRILAPQPRTDTPISKHTKPTDIWPEPQILEAFTSKILLVNTSNAPKAIGRHKHLSQILPSIGVASPTHGSTISRATNCSPPFSSAVSVDPDNLLPDQSCLKFQQLMQEYDCVYDPKKNGYNGAADPIQGTVNIGAFCTSRATNL